MSTDALDAIKALVRLLLERERLQLGGLPSVGASADLMALLKAIPSQALLATIKRHRLASLMQADPLVGELLPEVQSRLKVLGRVEAMAALALASFTREIAFLFEKAAIPMLVIKGIPLALQTTGSIVSRGRGDLDLFVDPKRLGEAVELLQSEGFKRLPDFPNNLESFWGRYSRWAGYEFSLVREGPGRPHWIDLHWALSNVRGPLPSFPNAWLYRQQTILSQQTVFTLCHHHAFQHACAHAAKDQWMCLRNLVDIDRLSRCCHQKSLQSLRYFRIIRWSCRVTYSVSGSYALRSLFYAEEATNKRVLGEAHLAQMRPCRSTGDLHWKPQNSFSIVLRMLRLSNNVEDWLRTLLYYTLLPAAFSDSETGKDRGLAGLIKARLRRLWQRVREMEGHKSVPSA